MTEEEVRQIYRCLLGRDPEDSDTVAAFLGYYPNVELGRRAVFASDEFAAYFARVTGRATPNDDLAAALALALLARAAAAAPPHVAPPAPEPAVCAGAAVFFPAVSTPRLAVVIGQATGPALADLLPFGQGASAILHIAPGYPPAVPLTSTMPDGTTCFRLGADAPALAGILDRLDRPIDALVLLGAPASPTWVDALRSHFAARTLLIIGRTAPAWDAASVSAAISAANPAEAVQSWQGLYLHHFGGWLLPVSYEPPTAPPSEPLPKAAPTLAIAAIVRDEAACVRNMLNSVLPIAKFYAVLDTGSADATQAVAQDFLAGCSIPFALTRRDHTAFDDDFSAMRNAALAMLPDWVDWVLMLDADEEITAEDHAPLLALIAGATHDAFALPRYNFPGSDKTGRMIAYPDRQLRLFRHTPGGRIGYTGAVHETIRGVQAGQPPLDASAMDGPRGGPHIHHLVRRFRTPEQEDRKQDFYRQIARRHGSA